MKIKTWLKTKGDKLFNQYYQVSIAVSTWVGDTKYRKRKPSITYDRVNQMKEKLQPGDILFERENWFMSNLFLPGFWKHGIIYVGTAADLKRLGLAQHPLIAPHMADYAKPDHLGFEHRLLEAISDGVVMSSMEEATDADYIAALRPRLTEAQLKEMIITAFSHFGKPYDFQFDFQTADKIVCTELLYRAFKKSLSFNLRKIVGKWACPADDILRKFIAERNTPNQEMDFVFFLDSDPKTQITSFKDEKALCDSLKRPSADFLLSQEEAPRK